MKIWKFLALIASLGANVLLALAHLSGFQAVSGTSAEMLALANKTQPEAAASHGGSDTSTSTVVPGIYASSAVVSVPMDDLAGLVQTEGDELLFGGTFSKLFDLPEGSAAQMKDLSRGWISEIKKMESAGISLVNEGHESFYMIRADPKAYAELLDRIQREIDGVPGIRNSAMIFRLVSKAPWIGSLREPYELNFTRGKDGEYYFNAPHLALAVSQESGNMLDLAKIRYGHLFDFDHIAAKTPPKAR
jgi:hypothetical protein